MASQKVPLYSLNDLKNSTDDALAPYLTSLPSPYKFKQDHTFTNIRLALGYTAVLIAGVTFYADWKLGWEATKSGTAGAVGAYFFLNALLTYWIMGVEEGRVFVGRREGGQKLTLKSSVQKHKPVYKLKVRYEAPSGKKWQDSEIEAPFTTWFSQDGYLQQPALKEWLASKIEVLGHAEGDKPKQVESIASSKDFEMSGGLQEGSDDASPAQGKATKRRTKRKG